MRTAAPALIGASIGLLYARRSFPPEVLEHSSLPGLYASAGAAICVLSVRLSTLFRSIWREFRGRKRDAE